MAIKFNQFTTGDVSNTGSADYLVGYDSTQDGVANGERRWTVATIANAVSGVMTAQLNNAFLPITGGSLTGPLSIYNTTTEGGQISLYESTGGGAWELDTGSGGTDAPGPLFRIFRDRGGTGANQTALAIQGTTGNVGIGTSTPGQKLTVVGDVSATGKLTSNNGANIYNGLETGVIISNTNDQPIATSGGFTASCLEIKSGGASQGGGASFMTFHRPNSYAVGFGLDTDDKLKVGGWSMGNASYEIVHAGNVATYLGATTAKAWVNFDGTLATPITPRASYNVSSITKIGTGRYTINFATAMTDDNYSVSTSGAAFTPTTTSASGGNYQGPASHSYLTTSVSLHCGNNESSPRDWEIVCAQVFGN